MLDRTKAPAFQRSLAFDLLQPEAAELPNGLRVFFLAGGQQEVIKVELVLKAGKWYEDADGASHFAATLLSKGTRGKSSLEIARIFDSYGAHLEVNPGLDVVSVALYSLTRNLPVALELLVELIRESVFPEKELEQAKNIFLQNLRVNNEKTSFQASKLFRRTLFGDGHPYGRELDERAVAEIRRDVVVSHYQQYFSDCYVIVSGRISDESKETILGTLSPLPRGQRHDRRFESAPVVPGRTLVDKEGSVQTSVRIGKRLIGRNHPDYFDILLLNHLLGGYFGSRLMKNIREDKGYTYGIYSSIHSLVHESYFVIGADLNKDSLGSAFSEIRKELTQLREELIPEEELRTARNHFIGSLQAEITTPFSHADKLKNRLLYNLSEDYYARLIARMDSVSAEELREAARRYLEPETLVEIGFG